MSDDTFLRRLSLACHAYAVKQGFWEASGNIGEKLALIHSEVSEALEAHRDEDIAGVREELADVIIRVCDLAGYLEADLDAAVSEKMAYNEGRPRLHGRRL